MDGFDDLLAPSRRALEDNPFEDPFASARSNSPDPWASYSHNPFQGDITPQPTIEQQQEHAPTLEPVLEPEAEPEPEPVASSDPLESAAVNEDPSPPHTPTPKSSGFRESAPSPETRKEPEPIPEPSTPTSPIIEQPPPQSPTPSSTFSRPEGAVVSPLDPHLENSFASLSLGGESLGGWQSGAQSTFVNGASLPITREPSVDDDDEEDNRPVLQSPRFKAKEAAQVSIAAPLH